MTRNQKHPSKKAEFKENLTLGSGRIVKSYRDTDLSIRGDFNANPGHKTCQRITQMLNDAQDKLDNHVPQRTWFGRFPVGRIDHIFVAKEIDVQACLVPRTTLTRIGSDHLPLIVDVVIPSDTSSISP
jgi:endonuclease/exonuclease/phosphatase family metal-dependent hydrolase